jgi:Sugar (and other) transporter
VFVISADSRIRFDIQPWRRVATRQSQFAKEDVFNRIMGLPDHDIHFDCDDRLLRWDNEQSRQCHRRSFRFPLPNIPGVRIGPHIFKPASLTTKSTFCDTTMYLYVSEIFPMEIRPIGMGFSLFGQFAATIILLQTAPIGIVNVGWKYYLLIICWCIVFIPIVYLFFPETARLSLEEIAAKFGDDVAVHVNDATDEQRKELDLYLKSKDVVHEDVSTVEDSKVA